jgi:putative tricarboxylic transport membrane protein
VKRLAEILTPTRIVALGLLLTAVGFGAASLGMAIWELGMPGPGLAPLLFSVCLLPVAGVLLVEPVSPEEREPLQLAPFTVGLLLIVFAIVVEFVGLMLPAAVFSTLWARFLYGRSWKVSLAAGVIIPVLLWAIFSFALGIPIALWTM